MQKQLFVSFILFIFLFSCTQFLEEDETTKNSYSGDDGCIYCHTNKSRLQVLAKEEEGGHGGGGG